MKSRSSAVFRLPNSLGEEGGDSPIVCRLEERNNTVPLITEVDWPFVEHRICKFNRRIWSRRVQKMQRAVYLDGPAECGWRL